MPCRNPYDISGQTQITWPGVPSSTGGTPQVAGWVIATSTPGRRNRRSARSRRRAGTRPRWWCSATSAAYRCSGSMYRVTVSTRGATSECRIAGSTRSWQKFGSPHSSQMLPPVPPPQVGQPPDTSTSYRYSPAGPTRAGACAGATAPEATSREKNACSPARYVGSALVTVYWSSGMSIIRNVSAISAL